MSGEPLFTIEGVSLAYRDADGRSMWALRGVDAAIWPDSFVCIIGPSGCGKSSLLRLMAGLITPTEGAIKMHGCPVNEPCHEIGLVFQNANLMPWRTVHDNIALPLELSGIPAAKSEGRVRAMIDLLGLEGFDDAYPSELSGGMAQRVAMGRALVYAPEVLLMDEPFGALDALTRERLSMELLRIWSEVEASGSGPRTIFMVTHSITESVLLSDRVLVMSPRPGTLLADVPIDLPRPRTLGMMHSEAFGALVSEIRSHIRADVGE